MDAIKFLQEKKRMCKHYHIYDECGGCPLKRCEHYIDCTAPALIESTVREVEEWSKTHPLVTNADKFKEVFGAEPRSCFGATLNVPLNMRQGCTDCKYKSGRYGDSCRSRDWWSEPYEATQQEG